MLGKIKKWYNRIFLPTGKSRYLRFVIAHHPNDSLIGEIKKSGSGYYEEHETPIIQSILARVQNPIMLDIGANIGLMSLNICHMNNSVKIHAFEPGPNQFRYLKENIEQNNLSSQVSLYNIALGSREGQEEFIIHADNHSSGDGFKDTGRAGNGQVIQVPSSTLDGWWKQSGQPHIYFIKIDTEGSELPILQHALALIQSCRPMILIEICDLNFKSYGFTYDQHLEFFSKLRYTVFDTVRKVRVNTLADLLPNQYYYVAIPQEIDSTSQEIFS